MLIMLFLRECLPLLENWPKWLVFICSSICGVCVLIIAQLLIICSALQGGFAMRRYLPELMPVVVDALLDGGAVSKRVVAVSTLGQIIQSTGYILLCSLFCVLLDYVFHIPTQFSVLCCEIFATSIFACLSEVSCHFDLIIVRVLHMPSSNVF